MSFTTEVQFMRMSHAKFARLHLSWAPGSISSSSYSVRDTVPVRSHVGNEEGFSERVAHPKLFISDPDPT